MKTPLFSAGSAPRVALGLGLVFGYRSFGYRPCFAESLGGNPALSYQGENALAGDPEPRGGLVGG